MPIDVICPKCQSKLRAPDEVAGKNVRCKKCQEKFKVPNPGAPVDSVGDTQQLSVLELPQPLPAAKPKAAPVVPEPMMLDDSTFEEPTPAVVKVAVVAKPASLPLPPAPVGDPFGFTGVAAEEDEDRPKKKKRPRNGDDEDDEDDDRPKKKRPRDDDEDEKPRKKKEKPLIGGEPTFAMPGAAEDPVAAYVPPPVHATQFTFEEPAPVSKRAKDDDQDDDRPKKKKKKRDDDDDDEDLPTKNAPGKPPKKSKKLLLILGGIGLVLFLGCAGAGAGFYFFVYKPAADAVSKATLTVGTNTLPSKDDGKGTNTRPTKPGGNQPIPPVGATVSEVTLPAEGAGAVAIVGMSDRYPLAFDMSTARQIHYFSHPLAAKVLAVFRTQLGFNGRGSEDTIALHSLDIKKTTEFTVSADGIPGPHIFDISDNGMRVAIEAPAGRLTIYDFDTKAKLFDGVDVYAGLPDRQGIAALAFGDANGETVAVIDRTGTVDVWKVNGKERTVTGKAGPKPAPAAAEIRKRGDTGGILAGKDGLRTVTWETGAMTPALALPPKSGQPLAVASQILADGKCRIAYAHKPDGAAGIEVWVVERPAVPAPDPAAPLWKISLPADAGSPTSLRWSDYNEVLTIGFGMNGSVLLCDWKTKTPAAYLKAVTGKTLIDTAGGAWLTATPESKGKATAVLAGRASEQATVSSRVKDYAEEAEKKKQLRLLLPKPEGLGEQ